MINEQLWDFPHSTVLKVMGETQQPLQKVLLKILIEQKVCFTEASISERPSKNGTYKAVSCQVVFEDKPQVEAVYNALNDAPEVKIFL